MGAKGRFLGVVILAGIVGAYLWKGSDAPPPVPTPPPSPPPEIVEEAPPQVNENALSFRIGGQVGEVDQSVVERLSMSVPGVQKATLDIENSVLRLEVAAPLFQEAVLAETMLRPGLGWTLSALEPK